ncbi:MAG: hypothetical protein ACOC3S_00510 [Bacteroidota bacterium]
MKINKENYEAYLLDYLEGNLPGNLKRELQDFLDQNPGIAAGITGLGEIKLIPDDLSSYNKESLYKDINKKNINKSNCSEFFIAFHEGLLNAKSREKLFIFLSKNISRNPEFKLYSKTYLKPYINIKFGKKNQLKKRKEINSFRIFLSFAAAVIAAIIIIYVPRNRGESNDKLAIEDTVNKTIPEIQDTVVGNRNESEESLAKNIIPESNEIKTLNGKHKDSDKEPYIMDKEKKDDDVNKKENIEIIAKATPRDIQKLDVEHNLPTIRVSFANTAVPAIRQPAVKNKNADDYMSVSEYLKNKAKEIVPMPKDETGELSFFAIARAGINGINKVTGTDLALEREYTMDGRIKAVTFEAGKIEIYRPVKNVNN